MKQKNNYLDLVTKGFFKKELKKELNTFRREVKSDMVSLETRIDIKMDRLKMEIDDNAQKYRDQVLTKLDGVMGELQTMREENIIGSHQITRLNDQVDNHEKRISRIEKTEQTV